MVGFSVNAIFTIGKQLDCHGTEDVTLSEEAKVESLIKKSK